MNINQPVREDGAAAAPSQPPTANMVPIPSKAARRGPPTRGYMAVATTSMGARHAHGDRGRGRDMRVDSLPAPLPLLP